MLLLKLGRLRFRLQRLKELYCKGPGFRAASCNTWPVETVRMLAGHFPRYDLFFVMVLAVAFPRLIRY